jgi:predicted AAA+ superfamily ATPase
LARGFFPFSLEYPKRELYRDALSQTVNAAIDVDIPAAAPKLSVVGVTRIKRLLAQIAGLPPFTCDLKNLMELTGVADERTLKKYLAYLEDADLIRTLNRSGAGLKAMRKPDKIYLGNPNLAQALAPTGSGQVGAIREIFFLNAFRVGHVVTLADRGDFLVDGKLVFEVGGASKERRQLREVDSGYYALDDIESGAGNTVPLWLLGFLY